MRRQILLFSALAPRGVSVNYRCLDDAPISAARITPFDGQNWEESAQSLSAHGTQNGL